MTQQADSFRCPQCGRLYPQPGTCAVQHPPAELERADPPAGGSSSTSGSSSSSSSSSPPAPAVDPVLAGVKLQLDNHATVLRSAIADAVGAVQKDAAANVAELKAELDRLRALLQPAAAAPAADAPATKSSGKGTRIA